LAQGTGVNSAKRILVFGATSAICHALLKLYATEGCSVFLAARNRDKLTTIADDLSVRGGTIAGSCSYDFNAYDKHEEVVAEAQSSLGNIDLVIVAHGSLPSQLECESSSAALKVCMDDNFTSAAVIIQCCAESLAQQGRGTLAVVSSVAGDRGRKSNYVYGAAKSGIDTLLQGLRGRFSGTGVNIVNIKPGMVISPMTADMKHGALWSTPQAIAPKIYRAIATGRAVCYVPGYWRLIMWVIRALPTRILARLPI
jgi:decaprenylphospho-beta-D-erythro-pentofuranosid-2-ulose 2-reductase